MYASCPLVPLRERPNKEQAMTTKRRKTKNKPTAAKMTIAELYEVLIGEYEIGVASVLGSAPVHGLLHRLPPAERKGWEYLLRKIHKLARDGFLPESRKT